MESILTPSLTQLTPIGDGDRFPCLVTSHADEHKCPIHTYAHTPRAAPRKYKILSLFISNKIQEYYNKTVDMKDFNLVETSVMRSTRSVGAEIIREIPA